MEWRALLARLGRAKLLDEEDPDNPRHLDTHPLVREYFGEQLRSERTDAWAEGNRRLYHHYRALMPEPRETIRDMEPLFLSVSCGCHAGLFREALHDIVVPRIQGGDASSALRVPETKWALLSTLAHFFEHQRWGASVRKGGQGHSLTIEDELLILTHAGQYLTTTRGQSAPEARICHERAELLCCSLDCPMLLYSALMGQWSYSIGTDKLAATIEIAKRIYAFSGVKE